MLGDTADRLIYLIRNLTISIKMLRLLFVCINVIFDTWRFISIRYYNILMAILLVPISLNSLHSFSIVVHIL